MKLREQAYLLADICAVVGLAHSTFYHAQAEANDGELRAVLKKSI
jgi:hypothetical protein